MAFVTGNASDWLDLRSKFLDFITTNPALVAAGQAWAIEWNRDAVTPGAPDVLLRGPGLTGQDAVYVAMRAESIAAADAYWLDFSGSAGASAGALAFNLHVNPQPTISRLYLNTAPMTYWFIANGRRFIIVVKISTTFQTVYAGLFLPFGSPLSYPYPLFVGGSAGVFGDPTQSARNWRSTNAGFSQWWDAFAFDFSQQPGYAWLLNPSGEWREVSGTGAVREFSFGPHDPQRDNVSIGRLYDESLNLEAPGLIRRMRAGYGGQYPLLPLTLVSNGTQKMSYGVMDGVYKCQGTENASENIIESDGIDNLVVQNCFRTDIGQYIAVALR